MNLKESNFFRDGVIVALGILGLIWFFYRLPAHHPVDSLVVENNAQEIEAKMDSIIISWGHRLRDPINQVTFESYEGTIEYLQQQGEKADPENIIIPLHYWEIRSFNITEGESPNYQKSGLFSPEGDLFSINLPMNYLLTERPVNRYAVSTAMQGQLIQNRSLLDSLITTLREYQHQSPIQGNLMERLFTEFFPDDISENYEDQLKEWIRRINKFYLDRSYWKGVSLEQDTVELIDESGIRYAKTTFNIVQAENMPESKLVLEILPAGSVKSMSLEIDTPGIENRLEDILTTTFLILFLIFDIWLLIIFYLRIKARAIDTRPALIMAVAAGFLTPAIIVLYFFRNLNFAAVFDGLAFVQYLLTLGIAGALSAIAFFVVTSVSDSVTRQYWSEKLYTWDLVRRGLFHNKPVGWAIIFGITIGAAATGIWMLAVSIYPNATIVADSTLVSNEFAIASVANLVLTLALTLVLVIPTYLILSNQIAGKTNKKWLIPIISGLIFGILCIIPFEIYPYEYNIAVNVLIGVLFGCVYLTFDFLTIAISLFMFFNFFTTADGWLIQNSPDANVFYVFSGLLVIAFFTGVHLILNGKENKALPEYIPEYIEDQAKEQRVKQELSIARIVQKTFLPTKEHRLTGIDIAGICVPAQETGGDYYDMIPLGESRAAIAVGDVSGKGIRAAFYMTFTKGVLHSLSAIILSPLELLNQLNRLFNENATRGTFISMVYGILEADKRKFTFARAGHNPVLWIKQDGDVEWLKPDGIGIGVAKGEMFLKKTRESEISMKEGDILVLYTDGITEMINSGGHFYGEERLEKLVVGIKKASSKKILEIIIDSVNEFKGLEKQHDDMTVIVIKVDSKANQ